MCGFQPVGNLDGQVQQLVKAKRSACDPLFQRLAFQQFHDNELPARVLVHVIDRADIGMVQPGKSYGLLVEAPERSLAG